MPRVGDNLRVTLDDLRRFALRRSLFGPVSLAAAIERLGFVQADPIRAPMTGETYIPRLANRRKSCGRH